MKIGVAGAGAVGCLFGSYLYKAGHQVTFLARGDHLSAMKQQGLKIKDVDGTYTVDGFFTDKESDLKESDIVLFTVKSDDTRNMANQLKKHLKKEAIVLTMQNGVDNEEVLCDIFGSDRVLSAATYVQAGISSPGNVNQQGRVKLVLGELDSKTKADCSRIVCAFQQAGISTIHTPNILEQKWNKLLWNVTFNPLSAMVSARVGQILDHNYLRKVAEDICLEAINVAQKVNVSMNREKAFERIFSNAEFARDHETSMLQDRLGGKKMEIESVCGYIVKKGEELHVHTPTLKTIYRMLKFIDN